MDKTDEIMNFVDANFSLEGMALSTAEKRVLRDCLAGKTTFEKEVKKVLAQYQEPAF